MNELLARWKKLAPREQWLTFGAGLVLLGMVYLTLVGDPLALRLKQQQAALLAAQARGLEAQNSLAELHAKLAADPNLPYRSSLLIAQASREQLLNEIDSGTSVLIKPAQMKQLLQTLLQAQPNLRLVALDSFSSPLQLPSVKAEAELDKSKEDAPAALTLYRHGVKLTLEGGYFDLLSYLQAIQASGWRLHWDSLDYQVDEAAPGQAKISLQLYTLSREEGWIGV